MVALATLTSNVWAEPALRVTAEPREALIFLNRTLQGQGQVELTELAPGKHLLRVSAGEDWEPYQQTLKVSAGEAPRDLKVVLKPGGAKWLRMGKSALQKSNYKEAIRCFREATHARPVPAHWWLGVAQWKAGNLEGALEGFRGYAQFMPRVPELHWMLGQVHEGRKQYDQAFTAYKAAALLLPELAGALDNLPAATESNIAQLQGRSGAIEHLRLGQLLMLKGRMAEACQEARLSLGSRAEEWKQQDWRRWEPPLPKPPKVEVAVPEDEVERIP